jgi:DUF1680 family protein
MKHGEAVCGPVGSRPIRRFTTSDTITLDFVLPMREEDRSVVERRLQGTGIRLGLLVLFLDSTDTQREEDMFVLPRHFYVKVKPHVLNTTLAVIKHCMMIGY